MSLIFSAKTWFFALLIALVLILLAVTRLQLPSQLIEFIVIENVNLDLSLEMDSAGQKLDELLLTHRKQLVRQPLIHAALLQQPKRENISAFWIDQCGVRQAELYRFIEWQRLNPGKVEAEEGQPPEWRYSSSNRNHRILGRLDVPANGVSYYEASAYCRVLNGRLPLLSEYQIATSGMDARLYPWGNQPNVKFWPYLDPMLNATQQCGSHSQASTPSQVHDLGHGMLEWVSLEATTLQAALMGAGVEDKPHELYALNFVSRVANKNDRIKYAGFRCVYNQAPAVAEQTPPSTESTLSTEWVSPWGSRQQAVRIAGGDYILGPPIDSRVVQLLKTTQPNEWLTLLGLYAKGGNQATPTFEISQCEVSRRGYRYFLADPLVRQGFFSHPLQNKDWNYQPLNWVRQLEAIDLPVVGVDWWSAYAFANWIGGRLPTLQEWRTAASGSGRALYVWGDQSKEKQQQFIVDNEIYPGLKACGTRGIDQTDKGVVDMAGNVSEWSRNIARLGDGYGMTIVGGNYMLPFVQSAKITHNSIADPEYRSMTLGFRVVRN